MDNDVDGMRIVSRRNTGPTDSILCTVDVPLKLTTEQVSVTSSFMTGGNNQIYGYYRTNTVLADRSGIIINNAFYTTPSTDTQDNNFAVPYAIYVIKNGFTE